MTDLRPGSEIADGIHWIKDTYVNLYITEHNDDLILIDTGLNKKAKQVFSYIKTELESRKISKILLTHHHVDHTRGLYALHDQFHSRIFVSDQDHDVVIGKRKSPLPNKRIFRPLFYILRNAIKAKPVTEVEITAENEILDDFVVHHFPGHTLGSLGFLKGGALFPGDAAVTNKKGGINLGPSIVTESMAQATATLQKIAKLKFDMLLSGHGTPILEDASDRVIEAAAKI
ncbi:MAG: putative metallo-hydrolase YflN [Candidatus Heimdallarchaeota archaeon LC_2]|nr:MAG: putative metallo-hydrolase YflN [Candidatus Heimdallarchaeota archaeon LC_2]